MMNGVARLLNSFGSQINDDMFKEKLSVVSIKEITKTAKERRAGSLGFTEAMLLIYNKRMKNALKWNNLYSVKAPNNGNKDKVKKKNDEEAEVQADAS